MSIFDILNISISCSPGHCDLTASQGLCSFSNPASILFPRLQCIGCKGAIVPFAIPCRSLRMALYLHISPLGACTSFMALEPGRSAAHLPAGVGRDPRARPRPNGKAGRGQRTSPGGRAPGFQGKQRKWIRSPRGRCLRRPEASVWPPRELSPFQTQPKCRLLPEAPGVGGRPESPRRQRWTGEGVGERGADLPFLPPAPPKNPSTYRPQHTHTQLPRCRVQRSRGRRKKGAWGRLRVGERRSCREEAGSAAKQDRGRGRGDGAEGMGAAGDRTPGRPAGGGAGAIGPLPHLAALLVVKADHHDVQNGPPRGALAAPPGLLHGRQPPRARTTATSTATGGGRVSGGAQAAGDRWSSGVTRAPHAAAPGAWRG